MSEHTIRTIRSLLEADDRLRGAERAFKQKGYKDRDIAQAYHRELLRAGMVNKADELVMDAAQENITKIVAELGKLDRMYNYIPFRGGPSTPIHSRHVPDGDGQSYGYIEIFAGRDDAGKGFALGGTLGLLTDLRYGLMAATFAPGPLIFHKGPAASGHVKNITQALGSKFRLTKRTPQYTWELV